MNKLIKYYKQHNWRNRIFNWGNGNITTGFCKIINGVEYTIYSGSIKEILKYLKRQDKKEAK